MLVRLQSDALGNTNLGGNMVKLSKQSELKRSLSAMKALITKVPETIKKV